MGAVIFLVLVVVWAMALGRLAGGTGTWLPTGGKS